MCERAFSIEKPEFNDSQQARALQFLVCMTSSRDTYSQKCLAAKSPSRSFFRDRPLSIHIIPLPFPSSSILFDASVLGPLPIYSAIRKEEKRVLTGFFLTGALRCRFFSVLLSAQRLREEGLGIDLFAQSTRRANAAPAPCAIDVFSLHSNA